MSVHDPISRKRTLDNNNNQESGETNKSKMIRSGEISNSSNNDDGFSQKMYSAYVKSALLALEKHDPSQIQVITDKIDSQSNSINISHFIIVLKNLITNISKLDNYACNKLIFAILQYDWLKYSDKNSEEYANFIDLYSHFLIVLVSTFPKYLYDVNNKLIGEFQIINGNDVTFSIHHQTLQKIIRYLPTCINSIPQILQKNFPHHITSANHELTNYVFNLIHIISYCSDLQFSIWQLILECCIKLDVELQNELDDLDDDVIEELINGKEDDEELLESNSVKSDSENDSDSDSDSDDDMGEVEWVENPRNTTANIKSLSSKLDKIISLLLNSTSKSFTKEEIDNGNGITLFNTITSLFKSHILPTHFTKSIQFILFHITQYQPELADSYLVLLVDVAFNTSEILEKRLKALQYLSSYIARARQLTKHQILFIVSFLSTWLNNYISERESEVLDTKNQQSGGMERFKLFYAAFQALLYIFCFRHESLYKKTFDKNSNSEWECDLDKFFQRVIIAKFNPLKYCDETVVYIFAKIATKLNVCYCYSIIEHNKRERMLQNNGSVVLPSAVGNFKQKQEFLDLEAYFPFDPLVLPNSKKIISDNYVEWSEVNPEEDDEDVGTSSHLDEDEDEDEEDDSSSSDSSNDSDSESDDSDSDSE
ncbi:unnamed protein product [Candida verbasci]|uniref:RNA polymerase I-specific transcription initiation factor RRN3 n=1 Tax=Candida verbasci TaxID=1227364 RepID=A0A9W4TSB0_9ASCO|nr:unnamed protein product [Candida verbasci]